MLTKVATINESARRLSVVQEGQSAVMQGGRPAVWEQLGWKSKVRCMTISQTYVTMWAEIQ